MAILSSGNMSFEIQFKSRDEEDWIRYDIFFCYKGQSIFDDRVLKDRTCSTYWKDRPYGGIKGEQIDEDDLIKYIEKALETGETQYYEAIEPGFLMAIYPNEFFPFMESNRHRVYLSEEANQRESDLELIRELAGGNLPYDPFTIIIRVDTYNFGDETSYSQEGPALIFTTTRHELRQFALKLREEYEAISQKSS